MRPLELIGGTGERIPARVATALGCELQKGGDQNRYHCDRGYVLPAEHPVKAWPRTCHQLDVVREPEKHVERVNARDGAMERYRLHEPFEPIYVADTDAFEKRNYKQCVAAGEAIHQLEDVATGTVCKAQGQYTTGHAQSLRKQICM